jgi:hypothetical protein
MARDVPYTPMPDAPGCEDDAANVEAAAVVASTPTTAVSVVVHHHAAATNETAQNIASVASIVIGCIVAGSVAVILIGLGALLAHAGRG